MFRHSNHFAELLCRHLVEVTPLELGLFLKFLGYVVESRHSKKLPQWRHRIPESFFTNLAQIQKLLAKLSPVLLQ